MELVVRAQGGQSAGADTVGKENLGSAVYPRSWCEQFLPSRRHVVKQTLVGTLQRHRSSQKNEKHHVREQGWKPDDLTALMKTAPDDRVNEQPAENQAAQQLPLDLADAFDSRCNAEDALSVKFKVAKIGAYKCTFFLYILIVVL